MAEATLLVPQIEKTRYQVLDAGIRPAYLTSIATLGLQEQLPYKGQPKDPAVEIYLAYELVGEELRTEDGTAIENDEGDSLPKVMSQRVKFIGGDLAKLTKIMKAIDPTGEATQGHKDVGGLLGSLCQVEVVKKEKKNAPGEFGNYVGTVSGAPNIPGWSPPDRVSDLNFFNFYEPDYEAYSKLPWWVQNVMKDSLDFQGSSLEALLAEHEVSGDAEEGEVAHKI